MAHVYAILYINNRFDSDYLSNINKGMKCMKIVLNKCFGGFSISKEAAEFMAKNGCEIAKKELELSEQSENKIWYGYGYIPGLDNNGYDRTSEHLVLAVETLKEKGHFESIATLADALQRDRGTVSKDVKVLSNAGFVRVEVRSFPGHGKRSEIFPAARKVRLELNL